MSNPFNRAQNPREWLLSSICWTVLGASGWWGLTVSLLTTCKDDSGFIISVVAAAVVQVLLWWLAVGRGRRLLARRPTTWLQLASWGWHVLLHLALLLALGLTLLYGLIIMAFSGDGPWFG